MFEEIMKSHKEADFPPSRENDPIFNEYCHLKMTIYPFWQSIFHHKEWEDNSERNKKQSKNCLKDRILDALNYIPDHRLYKYEDPVKLKQKLLQKYPFSKFSLSYLPKNYLVDEETETKDEIILLQGKFHSLKIVIDGMLKKIRVVVRISL